MTGFRWKLSVLVAFFVADLVGLVFLGYSAAQTPPVVVERSRMNAEGYAIIIASIFSGIGMLFGMWTTWQNSKIKKTTDAVALKTDDVVTQQKTLAGQMDGMKDALIASERVVAKQEGKDEQIAEAKSEAATKALGLAEGTAAAKTGAPTVDVVAPPVVKKPTS